MGENDRSQYKEVKRRHYENLVPLITQAREVMEDVLDSDDEKLKYQAAKFILEQSSDWISGTKIRGDNGLGGFGQMEPEEVDSSVSEVLN